VVVSLPQRDPYGLRFHLAIEAANQPVPAKVLLRWYLTPQETPPPLHPGERWQLEVRLKRPHGLSNPGSQDFSAWLLERDLGATGYVHRSPINQRVTPWVASPTTVIESLRESLRERFDRAGSDAPYLGVLIALALGDQQSISPALWRLFNQTGVVHLMSISGLHVTLFATLFGGMCGGLWRRLPAAPVWVPAQIIAVVSGALAALAYALLAGFAVPAQRTVYMLWAMGLGWLWRSHLSPSQIVAIALVVVVVLDPWAVLAPGFWLSFTAVAWLMFASAGRLQRLSRWREEFHAQWVVMIASLPLLLWFFQQYSLLAPLANLVAIPLVSGIITPLCLLFAVFPWPPALALAHALLSGLMFYLNWLASLPLLLWQQATPPWLLLGLTFPAVWWLLLPRGTPQRWLGCLPLLPLLSWSPPRPAPGEVWATVLDVGQGLAVHIQTSTHDLLYDTGPVYSQESNSGQRVVLPYLRAEGVNHLHGLVVSHADNDHSGGASSVLEGVAVDWLLASLPQHHPVWKNFPAKIPCVAGQRWQWDQVDFVVLHPDQAQADALNNRDQKIRSNGVSCVIQVRSRYGKLLLTADIERPEEAELLQRVADLQSEVVLAPHHGSRTSSSEAFITAVAARWVIFPLGYRNRYHHPHPAVWARWQQSGATLIRNDNSGAITARFQAQGIAVEGYREQHWRYWY
jgi:competence protein ComEC